MTLLAEASSTVRTTKGVLLWDTNIALCNYCANVRRKVSDLNRVSSYYQIDSVLRRVLVEDAYRYDRQNKT